MKRLPDQSKISTKKNIILSTRTGVYTTNNIDLRHSRGRTIDTGTGGYISHTTFRKYEARISLLYIAIGCRLRKDRFI